MAPMVITHISPDGEAWNHPKNAVWEQGCAACRTSIAIDADGTLWRLMDLVCPLISWKRSMDPPKTARDVTCWDYWDTLGCGIEFNETLDLLDRTRLREALAPYDAHTLAAVRLLVDSYPRVDVLTCNNAEAAPSMSAWIHRNIGPGLPVRCIGRGSPERKIAEGYKVYVDDCGLLAERVEHVKRFHSWAEVPSLVERASQLTGTTLLLANARWNEGVVNKGAFA